MDISNYVPGDTDVCTAASPVGDGVCEYHLPDWVQAQLLATLGPDHYLGQDNGEQDGRWVGRFSGGVPAPGVSRPAQYLHFQRHFARMASDLRWRLTSLSSLYYAPYFARHGLTTMVAAETGLLLLSIR